jgi:hypothetical protein
MESHGRVRPVAVQIGEVHLFLSSGDVEMLADGSTGWLREC